MIIVHPIFILLQGSDYLSGEGDDIIGEHGNEYYNNQSQSQCCNDESVAEECQSEICEALDNYSSDDYDESSCYPRSEYSDFESELCDSVSELSNSVLSEISRLSPGEFQKIPSCELLTQSDNDCVSEPNSRLSEISRLSLGELPKILTCESFTASTATLQSVREAERCCLPQEEADEESTSTLNNEEEYSETDLEVAAICNESANNVNMHDTHGDVAYLGYYPASNYNQQSAYAYVYQQSPGYQPSAYTSGYQQLPIASGYQQSQNASGYQQFAGYQQYVDCNQQCYLVPAHQPHGDNMMGARTSAATYHLPHHEIMNTTQFQLPNETTVTNSLQQPPINHVDDSVSTLQNEDIDALLSEVRDVVVQNLDPYHPSSQIQVLAEAANSKEIPEVCLSATPFPILSNVEHVQVSESVKPSPGYQPVSQEETETLPPVERFLDIDELLRDDSDTANEKETQEKATTFIQPLSQENLRTTHATICNRRCYKAWQN